MLLSYISSYSSSLLKDRTQTVSSLDEVRTHLMCGLPQGGILGPLLFLFYSADVTTITHRHSVSAHSYADDTQRHIHKKAEDLESSIPQLLLCIDELNC